MMCGSVRHTPNVAPDDASIVVLGPGVTEVAIANGTKATASPSKPEPLPATLCSTACEKP